MSTMQIRTRGSRESLRLYDLSDKEVAAIVADVRGDDGWAARSVVAGAIFPFVANGNGPATRRIHAMKCVAIRLAWLRRYGVVEKMQRADQRKAEMDMTDSYWELTPEGELFLRGRLTTQQRELLEGLGEERLIAATAALTDRFVGSTSIAADLMRREWLYGISRRSGR